MANKFILRAWQVIYYRRILITVIEIDYFLTFWGAIEYQFSFYIF